MEPTTTPEIKPEAKKDSWWDIVKFVVITIIIVIPIRMYIVQPFIVSGASMDNTFKDGQYLIVDEASYLFRNPVRGEVVIFKYPCPNLAVQNPKDCSVTSKYFIKRIIGLPGDTISDINGKVSILVGTTSRPLAEPYIQSDPTPSMIMTLGPDQYFAMGDNRAVSYDSRVWGPVSRQNIKGRAFLRLWPLNLIDYLPGNYKYDF